MGFFKKIFRRKKSTAGEGEDVVSSKGKKGRKQEIVNVPTEKQAQQVLRTNAIQRAPTQPGDSSNVNIPPAASYTPTNITSRDSNSSRDREVDGMAVSPNGQKSMSEHARVLSPRNQISGHPTSALNTNGKYQLNVRHDENLNLSNSAGSSLSPRLSHQQLQQFDLQNDGRSPPSTGIQAQSMYTMSADADVPRGQLQAMDDMNRSDASSSSFNLSTDAEDSEYETMRRRGVIPRSNRAQTSTLDTSVLSAISGPTAYTTEDERLFSALHTDDDLTTATSQSGLEGMKAMHHEQEMLVMPNRKPQPQPQPNPEDEHGRLGIYRRPTIKQSTYQTSLFQRSTETDDDLRAWTISPDSASTKDPSSTKSSASQKKSFAFDNPSTPRSLGSEGSTPRSIAPVDPPASTTSRSSAPRTFTSPSSRAPSSPSGFSRDPDFANFADFHAFGNNAFSGRNTGTINHKEGPSAWREEKKSPEISAPKQAPFSRDFGEFEKTFGSPREATQSGTTSTASKYAHSSPGVTDSSLSELLAQAKNKQRRGSRTNNRSSRASSSSVNSAPAITASFLRQHHNLGRYSSGGDSLGTNDREGTSVSDIIQSLEATNQSRSTNGARNSYGHRSVGDTGAVSTARAVKEKLREKRRKEREFGKGTEGSSSDNSDNEASESWLFDEVTGALGPRGIAADLESLSGRSNRSKNSQGNKSHKSHRSRSRRHRQGGSNRRHKSSSGDSVDSRGSRTSRYSHRSTKSFLSQMSEQSRSVANDLLRLEMQLAMVGSSENRDDIPARVGGGSVGGASLGGASRISRSGRKSTGSTRSPSNSGSLIASISHATRRTKMDVLAPPGKLGIILANKADSKGTVVSGVRTSSVLAEKISPGDRIVAIDGEDVSRMTVSEITTIMSRKADYDRVLTVLTIPKQLEPYDGQGNIARSPSKGSALTDSFDDGFSQQFRR